MKTVLKAEGLKKDYGSGVRALNGISLTVYEGEFLGIMGSSGSGKSTLLNCLAGITRPTEGDICFRNSSLTQCRQGQLADYRGKQIGYLFQNFELLENMTVQENILLPAFLHRMCDAACMERMRDLTLEFGIADILGRFPDQISGGQRQRAAAVRALILNPQIIFADEPSGALDSGNAKLLLTHLSRCNEKRGSTILMVTHDAAAASFCSRILLIRDGLLVHELRRDMPAESKEAFYHRILQVQSALEGGGILA